MITCALAMSAGLLTAATKKEQRKVEAFQAIHNSSGIDVYFSQSASYSVTVEADESCIDQIITESAGGTLTVKRKASVSGFNPFNRKSWEVKVYVSAPSLTEVSASGGADFYAEKLSCSSDFKVKLSGGADVKIKELSVDQSLSVSASGGADCSIQSATIGSGRFSASGGADIKASVNASGEVSCSASGGADILVSGKADAVKASASGGADVDIRKLVRNHTDTNKSGGGDVLK